MVCRSADTLLTGPGWVYEPKLDGFRVLLHRHGGTAHVQGRNGGNLTRRFPELVDAVQRLPVSSMVLDGELVAATSCGYDYDVLLRRMDAAPSTDPLVIGYVVFDLLHVDGTDLSRLPLSERRRQLEELVVPDPVTRLSVQSDDVQVAEEWLTTFADRGVEGVVAKKVSQPYRPGQRSWVKVQSVRTMDAPRGLLVASRTVRCSDTSVASTCLLPRVPRCSAGSCMSPGLRSAEARPVTAAGSGERRTGCRWSR